MKNNVYILPLLALGTSMQLIARDLEIENKLDKPVTVAYLFKRGGEGFASAFEGESVVVAPRSSKTIAVVAQPKGKSSIEWHRMLIATTEPEIQHLRSLTHPLAYIRRQDTKQWAHIDSHKETKIVIDDEMGVLKIKRGQVGDTEMGRNLIVHNQLDKPIKIAYLFAAGRRNIKKSIFDTGFVDVAAQTSKTIPVSTQPEDKDPYVWQRYIVVTTAQDTNAAKNASNPLVFAQQQDNRTWASVISKQETTLTVKYDENGAIQLTRGQAEGAKK